MSQAFPDQAPAMVAQTLPEQIAMTPSSTPGQYVTRFPPQKMGNSKPIAYGGCTLAVTVNAAYQTVSPRYHLYSAVGNFLGPALTDRSYTCTVRNVRDTGTFATRQVEVFQTLDNGETRSVQIALVDFQAQEPASVLEFSAKPKRTYPSVEETPLLDDIREQMVREGKASPRMIEMQKAVFGLKDKFYDQRHCVDGVMGQNMSGMAKTVTTSQDHLSLPEKKSADWFKCKVALETPSEHLSAAIFMMDGGLSFTPLAHDHKFVDDAGACSSLDFAFRVFSNEVDMNDWNLREMGTVVGGEGRTYSEARLWNQAGDMIANMTQQCILRPLPPKKSSL